MGQPIMGWILRLTKGRGPLVCAEARDAGYIRIAFISDAVVGRSAARGRNTIVRQNDTFLQISPTLGCGTSTRQVCEGFAAARPGLPQPQC